MGEGCEASVEKSEEEGAAAGEGCEASLEKSEEEEDDGTIGLAAPEKNSLPGINSDREKFVPPPSQLSELQSLRGTISSG